METPENDTQLEEESEDDSCSYSSEEEEEEEYYSSDSEEELSENMADSHPNLLKQQKKYEGKVTFYLEGDEKGGTTTKPKPRPSGSGLTSGSARARSSSAALHKSSASLQKSSASLQKSSAALQRQKAGGSGRSGVGNTTTGQRQQLSAPSRKDVTGQRQQLSAPSRKDVTGSRLRKNGGSVKSTSTLRQPSTVLTRNGNKEANVKSKTAGGSRGTVSREGSTQRATLSKQKSLPNQSQVLNTKSGNGRESKTTDSLSHPQTGKKQDKDTKKQTSVGKTRENSNTRQDSKVVKPLSKPVKVDETKTPEKAAPAKKAGGNNRAPAPITDLPSLSSSESEPKRSESSDNESPVKLYQPKPTLKELAQARTPTRLKGENGKNQLGIKNYQGKRFTEEGDSIISSDNQVFSFQKTPEIIMSMYAEREKDFMKNFSLSLVGPNVKISANIDEGVCTSDEGLPAIDEVKGEPETVTSETEIKCSPGVTIKKKNVGFNYLENLLHLMEQLSHLKVENNNLKRKCCYLEDSRSLLNLQNQMMSSARVKQMNKTESFISKAQNKMKHYLASPVHPLYQRGQSDSGAPFSPDLLDTPKPKHGKTSLQRSSSVGSIEELNIVSSIAEPQMRSHSTEKHEQQRSSSKGGAGVRKKVNKRFPKWTKMKKVFGKPESPSKPEGGAISAEEIIRVNKQKSVKPRPPPLPSSKSVDNGDLGGSISDDNCAVNTNNNSHLSVEPPGSSPPSPNSIQSEPGTAFPVTTGVETGLTFSGMEHEYEEIGPSSPRYVNIGGTQSVRTTVRTISQSDSCYSNQAYEDRCSLSDNEMDKLKYFTIGGPLIRRKSSPTLSLQGSGDLLSSFGLSAPVEMRRSSSFKTARTSRRSNMDDRSITSTAYITENLLSPEDAKRAQLQLRNRGDGEVHKKAKAAWFKVKDMIHTRKDSIKKTRRRSVSGGEEIEISPEGSSWEDRTHFPSDESYYEEMLQSEVDPLLMKEVTAPVTAASVYRSHTVKPVTSSPKPVRKRAASVKCASEFAAQGSPISTGKRDSVTVMTGAGSPIDISALMGGINEDFHKKMAEWEDKKKKGISGTAGDLEKGVNFTEDFIRRMEQWERMKGLEGSGHTKPKEVYTQKTSSPPPVASSAELPNLAGGETVEHLSETFSKTVQEWERIKEKRAKEPESTSSTGTKSRSRRPERSKSRERDKHPREKSRQRYEREIQKREQKLEKERQKLERMKQKLDQPSEWHSEGPDILSKFYDWELLKSFNSALSMGEQHHSRSRSEKRQRGESIAVMPSRERVMSDSLLNQLLPQDTEGGGVGNDHCSEVGAQNGFESPATTQPTTPLVDDSTSIDLGLTMETIAMLESANEKLSMALAEREDDITNMQNESQDLADKLQKMTEQHDNDIDQYKKELWASSKIGHYSIESQNLTSSLKQLKQKLNELQEYGEKIMVEKVQTNENEMTEKEKLTLREQELLEQISSIQSQLDTKAYVRGTEVFDTLYKHIHNVHKQVHNLQCGVLERDHMISSLQRHVMIQEVYNKLLNSELQRREAAVNFLKQQRKAGILRRWNTFHGQDITIRQDGTIELKKNNSDNTYHVVPSSVKKMKQETDALLKDRSEALALHFDWLDSMKEQIQEIQESQTSDADVQVSTDKTEIDTQTLLSLLNPRIPPGRLQWDGSEIDVCDKAVQKTITTADAAVFIEDVDVYENKQKLKWKLSGKGGSKTDKTVPQKGTVFKRMEIFDPRLTEKSPERLSKKLSSKSTESMEEEQCKNKTVIGRKVLDYEQCQHPDLSEDDKNEKELSPTMRQQLFFDSESVEPVSVVYQESGIAKSYRNQTFNSTSSSRSTLTSESPKLQRFSVTSSDIEVSFTLVISDQEEENAKDLKNEKDFAKRSSYSEDDLLQYVEANYYDLPPKEIVFRPCISSNSENDVHQNLPAEVTGSSSCDDILESRPPLSPIVRSKYARKQKAELKQQLEGRMSNTNKQKKLRHDKRQLSADKSTTYDKNEKARNRASSDSSTLHSKFGSDEIEETTAAKFTINMERYLIKPRALDAIPVQEKTIRSFEAQPFSRDCLFRKSPSPALRKPAVSAIRTLKTAEELLNDTQHKRGRSLSVPREGFGDTFHARGTTKSSEKSSGHTTPHSLPSASPTISRKSQTELLKSVTKRLSLPSGKLTPESTGQDDGAPRKDSSSSQPKRKALVLEPVVLDKNRQLRPHSVISYISEGGESQTNESIWQKLVKSSSLHRGTPQTASTSLKRRSHSRRPFKLFSHKFHHGSPKHGTVSKLCMHTVTLDTSESETSSNQFLPDDVIDLEGPVSAECSGTVTSSPTSGKKQKKKPFLEAKWLSRSKRFFKGSNFNRDSKSDSESQSEADDSSQTNSLCDNTSDSINLNIRGGHSLQQQQQQTKHLPGEYNQLQQYQTDETSMGELAMDTNSCYSNSIQSENYSNNSSEDFVDEDLGQVGDNRQRSHSEGNVHKIPIIQIHNEL